MTEASLTQDLLRALKAALPGAVVFKLCDRFTKGIPDICITRRQRVYWLEIKLLKAGDSFDACSDALQRLTMRRLDTQSGRVWYVVYDGRRKQKSVAVYRPDAFKHDKPELFVSGFDHRQVARFLEER